MLDGKEDYSKGFKEGMERAAEIPYVPPKLGNPTHGYTCGYNDGWYAKEKAIREAMQTDK